MAIFQDQILGQRYLTVIEKITGEDHSLLMHLNFDVALNKLVKQMAMEFQAGESFDRIPTGSDVAPTGHTKSLAPISEAHRAFVIHGGTGPVLLDQGLTLHENGVKENETIELHPRT